MVQDLSYNLCESLVENIGGVAGVDKKNPPQPVIFLTQWKLMGNSEVHGNEIWSCGEYSTVDGKYHILVQPQGGSIADIALTEPLRMDNNIADIIEFADGVGSLTRNFASVDMGTLTWSAGSTKQSGAYRMRTSSRQSVIQASASVLCAIYDTVTTNNTYNNIKGISLSSNGIIDVYDDNYNQSNSTSAFKTAMSGVELLYVLATPTTETIQVPQIQEADSYSCVISQGAKAVEWSSFETE